MTVSGVPSPVRSNVIEHIDAGGSAYLIERFERLVTVDSLEYRRENKIGCEPCPRYERGNLACPPHSPCFPDYIAGSDRALVLCYRVYMDQVREVPEEPKYRTAHMLVRGLLIEELYGHRKQGRLIAGAGACLACKTCVAETGESICRNPSRMIYSLESLGINLVSLSEEVLGLTLQWGGGELEAEHVAAMGAAFY